MAQVLAVAPACTAVGPSIVFLTPGQSPCWPGEKGLVHPHCPDRQAPVLESFHGCQWFCSVRTKAQAGWHRRLTQRVGAPDTVLPVHGHTFGAPAVVVPGEMWLSGVGHTRHILPGGPLSRPRGRPRSERHGSQGDSSGDGNSTSPYSHGAAALPVAFKRQAHGLIPNIQWTP